MIEIADVLAYEGIAILYERDGALEVAADRERRARKRNSRYHSGRVATGASQDRRPSSPNTRDRIVDPSSDRALADQECVRNSGQAIERLIIVVCNGLAGPICASHYQPIGGAMCEKQMMERRVGQHHAELTRVRRDTVQYRPRSGNDDRACARCK